MLPAAVVALAIPAMVADPQYFAADGPSGMPGALAISVLFVFVGLLVGSLLWLFLPDAARPAVSDDRAATPGRDGFAGGLLSPVLLLARAAFIVIGAVALDLRDALPGRLAAPTIVQALLGLPGVYGVRSQPALWTARAFSPPSAQRCSSPLYGRVQPPTPLAVPEPKASRRPIGVVAPSAPDLPRPRCLRHPWLRPRPERRARAAHEAEPRTD